MSSFMTENRISVFNPIFNSPKEKKLDISIFFWVELQMAARTGMYPESINKVASKMGARKGKRLDLK